MKLDVWRDPYKKDAQYQFGDFVSSYEPRKKSRAKKPVMLKYGTGCSSGGPDCFNCLLPACTWQAVWGREIEMRNLTTEVNRA